MQKKYPKPKPKKKRKSSYKGAKASLNNFRRGHIKSQKDCYHKVRFSEKKAIIKAKKFGQYKYLCSKCNWWHLSSSEKH